MIRAVICDDEEDAVTVIQYFIKSENIPIEIVGTAGNGLEAAQLIEREQPDLAFMDIHMPGKNGFDVILKAEHTKFIIVTAYGSFEYAQKAIRLGACDIISKPIDFGQMKKAISRAVGYDFTESPLVNAVLSYIHSHYTQKIELKDLARAAFCSEIHVSRAFKKHMGMTVLAYIHRLRIEQAVRLLQNGSLSIQEIASQTGYSNLNNFYKYFKQYAGCTPYAYTHEKQPSGPTDGKEPPHL
ncbi:MAG: helix-turn-helix domain-containing protein [Eubacteriales bacterium]|nr:helix-turn-helix domain-containing protein [Eubacteriales bacterium]